MNAIFHSPVFLKKMERITPFIRDNYPHWRAVSDNALNSMIAWYWNRNLMAIAEDRLEFRGICLIRPIRNLDDFLEPYAFCYTGRFVWVELLIADNPVSIASLLDQLVSKWGKHEIILWDRCERTQRGSPRMYTWEQFEKLCRRFTYGLSEKK